MLFIHPLVAGLTVITIFTVATFGWRYRLGHHRQSPAVHVRVGKILLGLLGLAWVLGVTGVAVANLPGTPPGQSGHFDTGTILLVGYGLSGALMLRYRQHRWARRLHPIVNTLLLLLVLDQVPLGINRLYKFGLIGPVPQDQLTRQVLAIKFGLQSPPVTTEPGRTYPLDPSASAQSYGSTWSADAGSLLQGECGCSGSYLRDCVTIDNRFPLFLFDQPVFGYLDYRAEFRIESGQVDQYAGLVFRAATPDNYYVARASASEGSVSLARFNNGARQVLQTFTAPVRLMTWQSLDVSAVGADVQLSLNGHPVGTVADEGWRTGHVGLGTKSASIARFRNVQATALPK